jgi:hypothetical protein
MILPCRTRLRPSFRNSLKVSTETAVNETSSALVDDILAQIALTGEGERDVHRGSIAKPAVARTPPLTHVW